MAKVFLRGGITHDISNENAIKLKESWLSKSEAVADFGSVSFKVSEIKSIILDEVVRIENKNTLLEKDREWKERFRQKTPKEKMNRCLSFVRLLFSLAKKDIHQFVKDRLEHFFEISPLRCFPDFDLFNEELDNYKFDLSPLQQSVFDSLVRCVNNDLSDIKYQERKILLNQETITDNDLSLLDLKL